MKMRSSSCFSVRVLLRKRFPRMGIFQRPGIMLFWSWSLIWKMPPMTVVPPSRQDLPPVFRSQRHVSPRARFQATAGSRFERPFRISACRRIFVVPGEASLRLNAVSCC